MTKELLKARVERRKESACEKVRKYLSEREPNFKILEVKNYENE